MSGRVQCAVIGAGVVGLAVARRLALSGLEVVVLEAANAIGTVTSARNSEVIHAGIYYPEGSWRARLCVAGRQQLYEYCDAAGVSHERLGKLIVATSAEQQPRLRELQAKGRANGVHDLRLLSKEEAMALEPSLRCEEALLSPSTGIIDSHGLMLALLGDAEDHGAALSLETPVLGGSVAPSDASSASGTIRLRCGSADGQAFALDCDRVVNAAGLNAPSVARSLAGFPRLCVPPQRYAKGNYYALTGVRSPFARLVYPVPESGAGLGVHATLDLRGRTRFGPDVEWVDRVEFSVDPRRADAFYAEVRKYWPALPDHALSPDYAGIRPKITLAGEPAADFVLQNARAHGVAGLVNLFGIESPGLTASLAIADAVYDIMLRK